MAKVNIEEKLSLVDEFWTPKVIAEMNDYQFKLAKMKGDFVWHNHVDTDEVFIVVKGSMCIEMKHETITLNEGEMYVVPKGVMYKPYATEECHVLLVEPQGVVNTGDTEGQLTAENDVWV